MKQEPKEEAVVTQAQMTKLADELESVVAAKAPPEGAQAAPGGVFPQVAALIAALRAGDWTAATAAIRDVLNVALGN